MPGGHLSHGVRPSASGVYFHAVAHGVDGDGRIDLDEVRRLALEHRPRLIVADITRWCGTRAQRRAAVRGFSPEPLTGGLGSVLVR